MRQERNGNADNERGFRKVSFEAPNTNMQKSYIGLSPGLACQDMDHVTFRSIQLSQSVSKISIVPALVLERNPYELKQETILV